MADSALPQLHTGKQVAAYITPTPYNSPNQIIRLFSALLNMLNVLPVDKTTA